MKIREMRFRDKNNPLRASHVQKSFSTHLERKVGYHFESCCYQRMVQRYQFPKASRFTDRHYCKDVPVTENMNSCKANEAKAWNTDSNPSIMNINDIVLEMVVEEF